MGIANCVHNRSVRRSERESFVSVKQKYIKFYIFKWQASKSHGAILIIDGLNMILRCIFMLRPSSGEAYNDRQLNPNFELWVEIFSVPTCFHVRIPISCMSVRPSVCTRRKEITLASYISLTVVIDTSKERSSRVLQHGKTKIRFFFK